MLRNVQVHIILTSVLCTKNQNNNTCVQHTFARYIRPDEGLPYELSFKPTSIYDMTKFRLFACWGQMQQTSLMLIVNKIYMTAKTYFELYYFLTTNERVAMTRQTIACSCLLYFFCFIFCFKSVKFECQYELLQSSKCVRS